MVSVKGEEHILDTLTNTLIHFPPSGTIFRFERIKVDIEIPALPEILIYPTIIRDQFNIHVSEKDNRTIFASIFAERGLPILTQYSLQSGDSSVWAKHMPARIYLIIIEKEGHRVVRKLIKQ